VKPQNLLLSKLSIDLPSFSLLPYQIPIKVKQLQNDMVAIKIKEFLIKQFLKNVNLNLEFKP